MVDLYADENFPTPVVRLLRDLGHDVLTALDAGQANRRIADPDVLRFASAAGRTLLTINRQDFIRLHRRNPVHGGIIVCTADPDPSGQATRVAAAINGHADLSGQLIRVNRPAGAGGR